MVVYAYHDGGQRSVLVDPEVKLGGALVRVETINAYHDGGQRTLVFARTPMTIDVQPTGWDRLLVTWTAPGAGADSYVLKSGGQIIYSGTDLSYLHTGLNDFSIYEYALDAIRGGTVIETVTGGSQTLVRLAPTFTATAAWWDAVGVDWDDPDQGSINEYRIYRDGVVIHQTSSPSGTYSDQGLSGSTTYNYQIRSFRPFGQEVAPRGLDSATTSPRPTQRKQVTLQPVVTNSYHTQSDNVFRTTDAYRTDARLYHGRYDGTWNTNRSKLWFPIPGDVRNCIQIHQVLFRAQNQHSYGGTGMTFGLGTHGQGGAEPTFGPTNGIFGTYFVGRGANTGWIDITAETASLFRTGGAWGITFEPTSTAQSQYGYFAPGASNELYIDYTVATG